MKASEVIREARNVLFERGWMQGDFTLYDDETGEAIEGAPVCSYGALYTAFYNDATKDEPILAVEFLLDALPEGVGFGIACWNDEPERTFDDVIAAFDKAEKLALIAEDSDA